MNRWKLAAAVVALLAVAGTAAAAPQSMARWRASAEAQFKVIWQELQRELGFGYARDMVAGALEADDDEYFPIDLVDYRDYVVAAICDSDCGDLDLILYDQDDNIVLADRDPDAEPVLTIPAGRSGRHYIEAVMVRCSVDPCYYAVQVFHR